MKKVTRSHQQRNTAIALAVTLALSMISLKTLADVQPDHSAQSDWRITAGFGIYVFPEFEGAKDHRILPLPMIDISYKNRVYFNFFEGLGVKMIDTDTFKLKGAIGYAFGRDEDDHSLYQGTGDIDGSAKLMLTAEVKTWRLTPFVKVSKYLSATEGMQTEIGLKTKFMFGETRSDPMLNLTVSTQYANQDYMMGFFGVNSQQSMNSSLALYTADAGFNSVSAGATYIHPFSGRWATTVNLKLSRLLGDAADSPLVLQQNQISGGLFVTYTF
ncbi:MAG: outer membrane protein [Phenylobacterium sp.]|jgi:outer membrane protein